MRTARTVKTSWFSCSSGRANNSSYRQTSTSTLGNLSSLTASRKNAPFRVLLSTILKVNPGFTIFSGNAGDPPPDPISIKEPVPGKCFAALTGSIIKRSRPSSLSAKAVKLIRTFPLCSSSTYEASFSAASISSATRARSARVSMRVARFRLTNGLLSLVCSKRCAKTI